jgi:hypothetical protein
MTIFSATARAGTDAERCFANAVGFRSVWASSKRPTQDLHDPLIVSGTFALREIHSMWPKQLHRPSLPKKETYAAAPAFYRLREVVRICALSRSTMPGAEPKNPPQVTLVLAVTLCALTRGTRAGTRSGQTAWRNRTTDNLGESNHRRYRAGPEGVKPFDLNRCDDRLTRHPLPRPGHFGMEVCVLRGLRQLD